MKKTLFLLLLFVLSLVYVRDVSAQSQCPTPRIPPQPAPVRGWIYPTENVYFTLESVGGLIPQSRDAVRQVFQQWSNWTSASSQHLNSFVECNGTDGTPACGTANNRITIIIGQPPGSPAGPAYSTVTGYAENGAPIGATIWLNLGNTASFNVDDFNGFLNALKKATHHELGHLHGLADQPVNPALPCGGQTAGMSIMNGMCGINDSAGNMPLSFTNCDTSAIQTGGVGGPGDGDGDGEDDGPPPGCDPFEEQQCQNAGGSIDQNCDCVFPQEEGFFGKPSMTYSVTVLDQSLLSLDVNKNGRIDGPSELVGNARLSKFDKLEFGGNGDGKIDPKDGVFPLLLLWRDSNRNGISEPGEVRTLSREIPLKYKGTGVIEMLFRSK